jgi:S1-C subfamily serine protease
MIEDLKNFGYVTGAYLGVMVMDVEASAQYYGIPAGAYVESVTDGGAAHRAGIQAKDIITEVGSYAVTSVSDLTRVLRKFAAGETVSVKVYRAGNMKTITVELDEKPREEIVEQTQPQQYQQQVPGWDAFQDWYNFFGG